MGGVLRASLTMKTKKRIRILEKCITVNHTYVISYISNIRYCIFLYFLISDVKIINIISNLVDRIFVSYRVG